MTDYVILIVIPNMYHCERCKEFISERRAVGIRDEKGNHYFHVEECRTNIEQILEALIRPVLFNAKNC